MKNPRKKGGQKKRVGLLPIPAPGLDGTWRDACVGCGKGTDTGLVVVGLVEWVITWLGLFGVPEDHATRMIAFDDEGKSHGLPSGKMRVTFKVCQGCADATGMGVKVGLITKEGKVPAYMQPGCEADA